MRLDQTGDLIHVGTKCLERPVVVDAQPHSGERGRLLVERVLVGTRETLGSDARAPDTRVGVDLDEHRSQIDQAVEIRRTARPDHDERAWMTQGAVDEPSRVGCEQLRCQARPRSALAS
ncbi:hypothetical protein [Amycolatopsis sp. NPDC102389]|uniref:hypothetical protein n=1 Tax=Amycolatopsis sp. NPDC102389 TaxID=3363941 RepID=UPI0037FFCCFC